MDHLHPDDERVEAEEAYVEEAGVNCTGVLEMNDGSERVMFHSPFEEELGAPGGHLDRYLGKHDRVFSSPLLGCHLYYYPPSEGRDYWSFVTMGLSGFDMDVDDPALQRCELMCFMPGDWTPPLSIGVGGDITSRNYMLEWIRELAAYVVRADAVFRHNDGLAGNFFGGMDPVFEGTLLQSAMLRRPDELVGDGFSSWRGRNPYTQEECTVNFYAVVPLTAAEYEFRKVNSSEALWSLLAQQFPPPFIARHDRRETALPAA